MSCPLHLPIHPPVATAGSPEGEARESVTVGRVVPVIHRPICRMGCPLHPPTHLPDGLSPSSTDPSAGWVVLFICRPTAGGDHREPPRAKPEHPSPSDELSLHSTTSVVATSRGPKNEYKHLLSSVDIITSSSCYTSFTNPPRVITSRAPASPSPTPSIGIGSSGFALGGSLRSPDHGPIPKRSLSCRASATASGTESSIESLLFKKMKPNRKSLNPLTNSTTRGITRR